MKEYTNTHQGLSEPEVRERLASFGYNELPSSKSRSLWKLAWQVLSEPMLLLLVAGAVLYMILGDLQEALVLSASVIIVMAIQLVQQSKTERALDALKNLSSPRALVIRDGKQIRIPGRDVVVDDLLILSEGDRVPADAMILDNSLLNADESLLTGESVSVHKRLWDGKEKPGPAGGDDLPFIYSGTLIVSGRAIAQVFATGEHSEIGKIGKSLQGVREERTQLSRETKKLVKYFALLALFLCIIVVIFFYLSRGNLINALLAGITLAMSILPEEFPVVLTVFMALGAWRMSKKNVLTRRSTAIESLGAATVLCTDKTGTLTYNKMTVQRVWNSEAESTLSEKTTQNIPSSHSEILVSSVLASMPDPFDPMEKAIHAACNTAIPSSCEVLQKLVLVREYPLSDSLRAMTNVWKNETSEELNASVKGSPEAVISLCKLDQDASDAIMKQVSAMAEDGLRVLGVATASIQSHELPEDQTAFTFRFLGLIGLADPIRATVPDAVQECYKAGIRVIMITGDFVGTAKAIARQIGLRNLDNVITGDELIALDDAQLKKRVSDVAIFARVVPEQKLRIVQALKANNEVVAMTGDGVNDAPALKAANIGISMGQRGTDVAREASAIVLTNDDFSSIVSAVRMGRRIYANLRKSFVYVFSMHVPIAGMSLIPAMFSNYPLIFFPVHIAFLELIIDPACSVVFEMEEEEANSMERPPRPTNERLFTKRMLGIGLAQGFGVLLVLLAIYWLGLRNAWDESLTRSYVFTTLVFSNIILISTNRSWSKNLFQIIRTPNKAMTFLVIGVIAIVVLFTQVPALTRIFHLSHLSFTELLICLGVGTGSVLWFEIYKLFHEKD